MSIAEISATFPRNPFEGYTTPSFWHIMKSLLAEGRLDDKMDPLPWSVISHTLYRLCADAAAIRRVVTSEGGDYGERLSFAPLIKHHPQDLLEQIAGSMLRSADNLSAATFQCVALAYHSHIQFAIPGFLDEVKVAAGKSGTKASQDAASDRLRRSLAARPVQARAILAHAGMLNGLLSQFMFGSPCEVIWVFDTALTIWAMLKFGGDIASGLIAARQSAQMTVIGWTRTPVVDQWITYGGPVWLHGLGAIIDLSPISVLTAFANRLDLLCWGLASRYRAVLTKLLMQDEIEVAS